MGSIPTGGIVVSEGLLILLMFANCVIDELYSALLKHLEKHCYIGFLE